MKRITRVSTGTGDKGQTGLADGHRVEKDSLRVEAYGTVDELNSHLGLALALGPCPELVTPLRAIQHSLFNLGADLATPHAEQPPKRPVSRIEAQHVTNLEDLIDEWVGVLGPLPEFILPGGSPPAAALHVARTVCRRAERLAVTLARAEPVSADALTYLNRLSDALFVMARLENMRHGRPEISWDARA